MEVSLSQLIFNSVKEYPDMIQIIINRQPISMPEKHSKHKPRKTRNSETSEASLARSRTAIQDLCICNKFEWFCTFTFDPKRFNSKDINLCMRYMKTWLRNSKNRHSRNLKYLVVPELHKSGALHFHALLSGYEGDSLLRPSHVFQHGRRVYNIRHWHFGFSSCVKIDSIEAVGSYVRKYITKDMPLFGGHNRYFCSQGLIRPTKSFNRYVDDLLRNSNAFFRVDSEHEYYTIDKSEIPFSDKKKFQLELDLETANVQP